MSEGNFASENGPQEVAERKAPERAKGFHPESTEEIIDDLTPKSEKKPSSLLGFLKSNTRKLAPLVLLASSIFGGSRLYQGSEGGNNLDAQQETSAWQMTIRDRLENIDTNITPGENFYQHGQLINRDENGKEIISGKNIKVTNYPAKEHSNGEKPTVIGELPVGTTVDKYLVKAGRDSDGTLQDRYAIFECKDIHGDVKDPHEDKIIQLDQDTICVVPWANVNSR